MWLNRGYKSSLGWVLRHQPADLRHGHPDGFVNVGLYIIVPKGFFPQQDTGRLVGHHHGRPGCIVPGDARQDQRIYQHRARRTLAVQDVLAFVGGNAAQNQGRMYVTLKPLNRAQG